MFCAAIILTAHAVVTEDSSGKFMMAFGFPLSFGISGITDLLMYYKYDIGKHDDSCLYDRNQDDMGCFEAVWIHESPAENYHWLCNRMSH